MVAVGVPELTFKTANLAEAVEVPPTNKSRVEFLSWAVPRDCCQRMEEPTAVAQEPNVGAPEPPESKQSPVVPAALVPNTPDPLVYTIPPAVLRPEKVIVPEEVSPDRPVNVPVAVMFPLFASVSLVVPEALAVKMLPELS